MAAPDLEKAADIKERLGKGQSQAQIHRETGYARDTIRKVGTSTLYDKDGNTVLQWVKEKPNKESISIDAIRAAFEDYRAPLVKSTVTADSDLLTVYNIADHHLGLYAWAAETGSDYDLAIGERILIDAMSELVDRSPPSGTAIVLNLGDFLHADNAQNRTEKSGNSLDVDTRYAKVLKVGVQVLITCVEKALARHSRVIVRCLPGNHDPHTALSLSIALSCFFASNPRVTVDLDPSKFFFHQHGKVMIAATHGDMVKLAKFPGVMAAYKPAMWGATVHRYGYTGHIHNQRSVEENGASCEAFRTLAAKDAWHHGSGYSSGRSMVAITHHVMRGEISRNTVNVHLDAA
jgi:hypothetical protein